MIITNEHLTVLRSILVGDDKIDLDLERHPEVVENGDAQAFPALVYSALSLAARRRFPQDWTRGDVIKFVAKVRAELTDIVDKLDTRAAEHELRVVLGEKLPAFPDEEARTRAQMLLLSALVLDMGPNDAELDQFLADARDYANQAW